METTIPKWPPLAIKKKKKGLEIKDREQNTEHTINVLFPALKMVKLLLL